MRRLTPDPTDVDPGALITGLRLGERAGGARPYTVVNFVASADGRASVDGGSTGLAVDGDKDIFRTLRACADAVLVGTGTLAAEPYGRLVRDPEFVALRARLGLVFQPLLVTVTRSGTHPGAPLLDDPASSIVVYSGADLDLSDVAARAEVVRWAPGDLTMTAVLGNLRARGVRLLLCEGGPTVFAHLVAEDLVDELFLTVAARLVGGEERTVTRDLALPTPRRLELEWALEQGGSLFLRYGLRA